MCQRPCEQKNLWIDQSLNIFLSDNALQNFNCPFFIVIKHFIVTNVNLFPGQMINVPETTVEEMQDQKMVFLVRVDLNMGVGKIAAQVGHAVLDAY